MFKNPKDYESILIKSLTAMDRTNYEIDKEGKKKFFDIIFLCLEQNNSHPSQLVEVTKYLCKYVFKSNNGSEIALAYGKIMSRKAEKFDVNILINISKFILSSSSTAAESNKQIIFHIFVRLTQNYKFNDLELNFIFLNFLCDFIKRNVQKINNEEIVFLNLPDYQKIFSIHAFDKLQMKEKISEHLYLAINFSELENSWEKLLKRGENRKILNKNNLLLMVYYKFIFEGCNQQSYLIDKTEEFFIELLKEKNWILASNASNIFYYFKKSDKITTILNESLHNFDMSEIAKRDGDENSVDQLNFLANFFSKKISASSYEEFFEFLSKNANKIETKEFGKILNLTKKMFSMKKNDEIQKIIFKEVIFSIFFIKPKDFFQQNISYLVSLVSSKFLNKIMKKFI